MREILFRGKRVDNGEWAESPYPYGTMSSGVVQHDFIFQTVGQYTGLTDNNGTKIFEGDVVRCVSRLDYANMVVIFEDGDFRMVKCEDYKTYTTGNGYFSVRCFHKKVIGNIYDNPELIEDMDIKPAAKRGDAPAEQLALAPAT